MGLLTDAIGNVLSEAMLVQVSIPGGGVVIGRIGKLEQGGHHAVVSPTQDAKNQPALVVVVAEVPVYAQAGSRVGQLIALREPIQPKRDS